MSALNANASEWKPTENAMSSFLLPETTSAMANEPTHEEMLGDNFGEDGLPPAYYPTFAKGDDLANDEEDPSNAEWMDVFQKVLEKTEYFIERQLHPELEAQEGGAGSTPSKEAAPPPAPLAVPKKIVPKPQITAASQAPLTVNGNHRWKKPTKSEKRRDLAQKGAFEAFAKALLHSVSPFMEPLRARCRTSLPHLKLDQRFGKSGQPQTAIAQFVVAPLVTNYRPRHFHDVTPGDLMEFHYDLAQVLPQLPSAYALVVGYGPVWHRYAVPYCYISCREYRQEVLSLCPDEVPNSRAEATYDDDIIKDVTEVVLSVEELEPLQKMSMVQAMSKRLNLAPLYDALDAIFKPLENYQVEIWDIYSTPSRFLIKASRLELEQKPQPITLYNDPTLWAELPVVSRSKLLESMSDRVSGAVSSPSAVSGTSPAAPPPVHLEGVRSQPMEEAKASRPALGKTAPRPVASSNLMVVVPMACTVLSVAATAIILVRKLRATSQ